MCGYAIEWIPGINFPALQHRGLKISQHEVLKLKINDAGKAKYHPIKMQHFKLPFQTELNDQFDQPIELSNGNYLLFTGEIFNVPKEYDNDVEYLKKFFSHPEWERMIGGPEYNRWDGFWAITILTQKGVYAFTDPLGQKQLYYNVKGLASEMKAFKMESENFIENRNFDSKKPCPGKSTPFLDVFRVVPNELLFFKSSDGYQSPEVVKKDLYNFRLPKVPAHSPKLLRKIIIDSVRSRIHDVKGQGIQNTLFLSGGLDSTIILYVLKELNAFHLFEFITLENGPDEIYIRFLEEQLKIEVKRIQTNSWHLMSETQKTEILKQYESPLELGSLLPNYYLCKEAQTRSLITGDGADELFSGYKRAQESDTQNYDVFTELPYYHNIRLDRMGSMFTKEVRSPFMGHDVVRFALACPYDIRKNKSILKDAFPDVPEQIKNRKKEPLRIKDMRFNKEDYQKNILRTFKKIFKFN